jgi:hypothetical protein
VRIAQAVDGFLVRITGLPGTQIGKSLNTTHAPKPCISDAEAIR